MIDNRKKYTTGRLPHKLYLSEDTRAALEHESKRLGVPMSVVVDLMIRKHLIEERK